MSSGTINACSGMFYDNGGANGNYPNFENRTQSFCSDNGQKIQVNFNPLAFSLSSNDTLFVFDGSTVAANPLAILVAGSNVETLTSSGTCLTFRFKSVASPASGWAAQFSCVAAPSSQITYSLSSGLRYVCSGLFTDDGGVSGNYANLSGGSKVQTFTSYNSSRLKINFQQFVTETGVDLLRVYDGPGTNSPLIGTYSGNIAPFSIEGTGRTLTFAFNSNFQTTFAGWQGTFECTTPVLPVYNMGNGTTTSCDGVFYDAGGSRANYPQFENRTQTFCSSNGQKVQFNFNRLANALQSGDSLWVYDGNSAGSPLNGILVNSSNVETITSTGTCLTFRFKSGAANAQAGWQAIMTCVSEAPSSIVYSISSGVRVVCSGVFTDDGGLTGNYSNLSGGTKTQTFQSGTGGRLSVVFSSFAMETNVDYLDIFDGPNSSFPRLARLTGTVASGTTFSSTGSQLTFVMYSNFQTTFSGWVANFACSGPALPTYNMTSGTINTCSGVFYDNGGGGNVYPINENRVQTFCSDNGQRIVFDFTNFELKGTDTLWAYDGNSTGAQLIGAYLNALLPEKITASGTCITFKFKSTNSGSLSGWKALISCTSAAASSTIYAMGNGIRAACNGLFTDNGGLNSDYSNNLARFQTFQALDGQRIRMNFQSFSTESGSDFLDIYDGPNNLAPLIGRFSGGVGPGIVTSTGNSLTFFFSSDQSVTGNWLANIECAGPVPTTYNMSSGTVNTCNGAFYDAGGVVGSYISGENRTQTFCAEGGQKIQFNFNNKAFRLGQNDTLFAFDGNSLGSPLIGYYLLNSFVEPIISSGSCITFRFRSDNLNSNDQGWAALATCTTAVPNGLVYPMSPGLRVVCSGVFTDDGGVSGNYSNNLGRFQTFQSQGNTRLKFEFTQFLTEGNSDFLYVYDGPNNQHPLIGTYTGSTSPGIIFSSGNTLTFYFTSDGSATNSGWNANISCAGPSLPQISMSNTAINLCEGMWYDNGGANLPYTVNQNLIQTFCSSTGQRFVFQFNPAVNAFGSSDTLFAFDGNSVSSPIIGAYVISGPIEPIISSGSCITFRFKSDLTNSNGLGWAAYFTCTDNPPQPEVFAMRPGIRGGCNGIFADQGGLTGLYSSNMSRVMTFLSNTVGAKLQFNFTQFNTESGSDILRIYDGPNTTSTLIGSYSGGTSPGIITSTGSSLTFWFTSDGSVTRDGWQASISCVSNVPLVGTLNGPFCAGSLLQIPFTSPTQSIGNVFTAQLSDPLGTFSNPIVLGTLNATGSGTFQGNLPTNLSLSGKYRIRIIGSNPVNAGSSSAPFTILALPSQAGLISGSSSVCAGTQNVTYSISTVAGANNYSWTVPTGSTIVSGQGTTSISVNMGSASGDISVTPSNSCGSGPIRNFTLIINTATAPTASITSNATNNSVCQGGNVNFSSSVSAGSNPQYQWILNGSDFSGAISPSFSLNNLNSNATVSVRVTAANGCFNPIIIQSSAISISVQPSVNVSASISSNATGNSLCSGNAVVFSSVLVNEGTSPLRSWTVNGNPVLGANGPIFSPTNLQNGDVVSLLLTSSAPCANPASIVSNQITMIVNQTVTPTVSVTSNTGGNQVCAGNSLTLNANVSNGGDSPQYQWFQNGNLINGEANASYTIPSGLVGSQNFTVRLTSNAICATQTQVTSSVFTVTGVSSVTPSVSVSSNISSGPICVGTSITFTATPINGGSTPGYVWRINGNPVSGQTGSTFTTSTLSNNDQVSVVLTSNDPCVSPASAISSGTIVNLVTSITPSITATSSILGNTICAGTEIVFTSNPTNGGSNPGYVWRINGNPVSGQTGATFATSSLTNGQTVSVVLTSSFTCASPSTASSDPITVTVNSIVSPSVSVSSSQGNTICQNSSTTLTANPSNGGSAPGYQWFLNGNSISGQTGATLVTPTTLTGTANYTVLLSSNANCASPTQVSSQNFALTLTPNTLPSVAFTSSVPGNTICNGQSIAFTATPTNGGITPQYQWMVNGNDVSGQTSATFTSTTISNNAEISVRMTSNAVCPLPATVTSLVQVVNVTPNSPATVSVTSDATANTICNGQSVTFTANPVNGGSNPGYQWVLNGNDIPNQTGPTFQTSSLANNNLVSVRITSNSTCANPAIGTSPAITLNVTPTVTPTVAIGSQPTGTSFCPGTQIQFFATPINGGNNPTYQWRVNGNLVPNAIGPAFQLSLGQASTVTATLISNAACANPVTVNSSGVILSLTAHPPVSAQNDTSICEATNAFSLRASPEGGIWTGTGISSAGIFTPGNPGNYKAYYSFTASGTGCTGIDSVQILVKARPIISFPTQQPICSTGPSRQLSATPSGGVWSGTGVSATGLFNPVTSGPGQQILSYTVSQNTCSASKVLVLNVSAPPTLDVGGPESVCFATDQVQLVGLPSGGNWSGNGVNSQGVFTPGFVNPGSSVVLTYTATVDGCTASKTKTMTVSLNTLSVNAGTDQTVCASDAAFVLTGVIGSGGTWSGTGVTSSGVFNPNNSGLGNFNLTYTVTFNQSPGCSGSDTKTVSVIASPQAPQVQADTVCRQGTAVLRAFGVASVYNWYNSGTGGTAITGQVSPIFTTPVLNASQTYFVSQKAGAGESPRTAVQAFVNSFNNASFLPSGSPIVLTANPSNGQNYQWLLAGNPISGATQSIFQPTQNGDYSVIVGLDGCSDTSAQQFLVVTEMAEPLSSPPWKAYPNPASQQLFLVGEGIEDIRILDLLGRVVMEEKGIEQKPISVSRLPCGIYTLQMRGKDKIQKVKLVKR
jgi:hypothetical protein